MLFDLVCGSLPWSEAAKARDKEQVALLKKQYFFQPEMFFDWIGTHRADCALSDTAKENCLKLLDHLKNLAFEDMPDYNLIESCLSGFTHGGIAPSSDFDLRGGENNYKFDTAHSSSKQWQRCLSCKAKVLGRVYKRAMGAADPIDNLANRFGPIVEVNPTAA